MPRRKRKQAHAIRPRVFDSMHTWPMLGMDEVGTGCAAGPIAAAGVVLPKDQAFLDVLEEQGLKDSKQMTPLARERVSELILQHASFSVVEFIHPRELEKLGQGRALDALFDRICAKFRNKYGSGGSIVLDGNKRTRLDYFHVAVPQGDQRSLTIAAASVIAKVGRDAFMVEYAEYFPGYGFEAHKGYLTRDHKDALEKLGVCEMHRCNVKPVKERLRGEPPPWETSGS
jgi:ribonuclease HII